MMVDPNEVSSRDMVALELNAKHFGISHLQLMENAGSAVAGEVIKRAKKGRCVVFCGCGKNGGDGFVAARHLFSLGFKVTVLLIGREGSIEYENCRRNWEAIKCLRGIETIQCADSSLIPSIKRSDVVIDALLGIGIKGDLRPPLLQAVQAINEIKGYKVSIDVPTGIDPDSGKVMGSAVRADLTVTFHRAKVGLSKAKRHTGEIVVRDIGLPSEIESYVGPGDLYLVEKGRPMEAHKGDFGRLMIIGGSDVYSGAPALAAMAALRTGVDIVYIAAPEKTAYGISSMSPNLITIKLRGEILGPKSVATIRGWLEKADALIVGPGLGLHKDTVQSVWSVLQIMERMRLPVLLDADGLKAFAQARRKFKIPNLVLTPHAGELRMLTGEEPPKRLEGRSKEVRAKAKEIGAVILLKGNVDVISDGARVKYNFTGNPGMTVGGTGDTLSGIVGAFLAQGFDPFESACAGAFVNGAAGDMAAEELGYHLVPMDIVQRIPRVLELARG